MGFKRSNFLKHETEQYKKNIKEKISYSKMKGKRSFSIYSWETAHLSIVGCREGFDTLTLGSPSCRTHLSLLPQMAGVTVTRGYRWETFQRWTPQSAEGLEGEGVWRRVSWLPRHSLRRLGEGGTILHPFLFLCFLSLFPRHPSLDFYFRSCCSSGILTLS